MAVKFDGNFGELFRDPSEVEVLSHSGDWEKQRRFSSSFFSSSSVSPTLFLSPLLSISLALFASLSISQLSSLNPPALSLSPAHILSSHYTSSLSLSLSLSLSHTHTHSRHLSLSHT